jgi:hypothetical protein
MFSQHHEECPLEHSITEYVQLKDIPNRQYSPDENSWSCEAYQSAEIVQRPQSADTVAHEALFQVFTEHLSDIPEVSLSMTIPDDTQHMYWCQVTVDLPQSPERQEEIGLQIGHAITEWLAS